MCGHITKGRKSCIGYKLLVLQIHNTVCLHPVFHSAAVYPSPGQPNWPSVPVYWFDRASSSFYLSSANGCLWSSNQGCSNSNIVLPPSSRECDVKRGNSVPILAVLVFECHETTVLHPTTADRRVHNRWIQHYVVLRHGAVRYYEFLISRHRFSLQLEPAFQKANLDKSSVLLQPDRGIWSELVVFIFAVSHVAHKFLPSWTLHYARRWYTCELLQLPLLDHVGYRSQ